MADVYITNRGVPRTFRNGRIYGGYNFDSINNTFNGQIPLIHIESGRITDLASRTVVVDFKTEFTNKPTCMELKVYRLIENIPTAGKWIKQDVLHYFDDDVDWVVTTGFSLFIDDNEDLSGVVIEYSFI